jgi:hypothetical protein
MMRDFSQIVIIVLSAILPSYGFAQTQTAEAVTVVDAEDNQPVSCFVRGIPPDGKIVDLGRTEPSGQFKVTVHCVTGYALQFIPEDSSVYYETFRYCADAIAHAVKLKRMHQPENRKFNLKLKDSLDSNPALAALASNELADKVPSTPESQSYNITTYTQFSKFLSIDKPTAYDSKQHKIVPSTELENAVKVLQNERGLDVNGKIDFRTLKSASGIERLDESFHGT